MDMGSRPCRRLVLTAKTVQRKIIADDVLSRVDPETEQPGYTLQSPGGAVVAINDRSRLNTDTVCGGKLERGGCLFFPLELQAQKRTGCDGGDTAKEKE